MIRYPLGSENIAMYGIVAMVLFIVGSLVMIYLVRNIPVPPPVMRPEDFFWLLRNKRYGAALLAAWLMILSWTLRTTVWAVVASFVTALGAIAVSVSGWQLPEALRELRRMLHEYYLYRHAPQQSP